MADSFYLTGLYTNGFILAPQFRGSVTITTTGTVEDSTGPGVVLFGGGWTLANFGVINVWDDSVYVPSGFSTVTNAGTIAGYHTGIDIGPQSTVTNTGLISMSNRYPGINMFAGGSLTNGAPSVTTALIFGGVAGVQAGAFVPGSTSATITNYATISGSNAGLLLSAGASISNIGSAALIWGNNDGVYVGGAAGTLINTGTVLSVGANSHAVDLEQGGTVVNGSSSDATARISGGLDGVFVKGAAATVTNYGQISANAHFHGNNNFSDYAGVKLNAGGTVTNAAGASISGYRYGVWITGGGTVNNAGIVSGGINGVVLHGGGTVFNAASGGIVGGVSVFDGAGTVFNDGFITGGEGAVFLEDGGTVINGAPDDTSASISGEFNLGIRIYQPGTVVNYGTVANATNLYDGGTVVNGAGGATAASMGDINDRYALLTITNDATIAGSGGNFGYGPVGGGINVVLGGSLSLVNGGTGDTGALVSGYATGIDAQYGAQVSNYGTIEATAQEGRYAYFGIRPTGIGIAASSGTITNGAVGSNAALISGYRYGLDLGGGGNSVSNVGTIQATGYGASGIAVVINGNGTVVNAGTITAATGSALVLRGSGGITNDSGGLIEGSTGIALQGAGATIDNFGTIIGTGGTAVALQNGDETLKIEAGSAILGAVTGLQASDTIDLVGVQVTSIVSSDGTLTLLDNTATIASLDLDLNMPAGAFTVISDGQGGTDVGIARPSGNDITGTYAGGLILSNPATQNPTTIAASGYLAPLAGYGVLGLAGTAWTLTNLGTIQAAIYGNPVPDGVTLQSGGVVTNGANALINGLSRGVEIDGAAGTVINSGTVTGSGHYAYGIELTQGGSVVNGSIIDSTARIAGGREGVFIGSAAGTIANYGTISGYFGIQLAAGGAIENSGTAALISGARSAINASNGSIYNSGTILGDIGLAGGGSVTNSGTGALIAGSQYVIDAFGGPATVVNSGTVGSIVFYDGGTVTNLGTSSVITGGGTVDAIIVESTPATVTNAGTVDGEIIIDAGGTITNNGLIFDNQHGNWAVTTFLGTPGTVINYGTITGSTLASVFLWGGGVFTNSGSGAVVYGASEGLSGAASSVVNSGTISGSLLGAVIDSGSVTNLAGGLIEGNNFGVYVNSTYANVSNGGTILSGGGIGINVLGGTVTNYASNALIAGGTDGVDIKTASGTVANTGTMSGGRYGVYLAAGGTVTNDAGGLIAGNGTGVAISGGAGTVVNAGTMSGGTSGAAVTLDGNFGGLVVADPGAVIQGSVSGGNADASTLELAAGAGVGTLSGLGTQFVRFGTVNVDNNANWLITGNNTIGSAVTLTVRADAEVTEYGSLFNSGSIGGGISLGAGSYLYNTASGLITHYQFYGATVRGVGGPSTVANAGSIIATGNRDAAVLLQAGGTVANTGTITSDGQFGYGVKLGAGGTIINGAGGATNAVISAAKYSRAIQSYNAGATTIVNYGTVSGGIAAYLYDGGSVTNADSGLMQGGDGIFARIGGITVANEGTIAASDYAIYSGHGGSVTNGVSGSSGALIEGEICLQHAQGTVVNYGTIASIAKYSEYGVLFSAGGTVTNGVGALIEGNLAGVAMFFGNSTVSNLGTIEGLQHSGVAFLGAGSLTNRGLIEGPTGIKFQRIQAGAPGTIDNFGTIIGNNGTAVAFADSAETLKIELGSTLSGDFAGFQGSDLIDLVDTEATSLVISGNTLTVLDGIATVASFGFTAGASLSDLILTSDGNGGTDIGLTEPSGHYVGGTYDHTVVLSNPATQNPTTIGLTGSISAGAGDGVIGLANAAWQLTNLGTIQALAFNNYSGAYTGVALRAGGQITNGVNALIEAGDKAVAIYAASGTVTNYGTFEANNTGVYLSSGGSVANQAGALIQAAQGIFIRGSGTITNAGTIAANRSIYLYDGGTFTNSVGGLLTGTDGDVYVFNGSASVTNLGTFDAGNYGARAVLLGEGGVVTNGAVGITSATMNGVIYAPSGAATVTNYATISATQPAIDLQAGGAVINGPNGDTAALIASGNVAVIIRGGAGSVANGGTIAGAAGVLLGSSGTVTNSGSITAAQGTGVQLNAGGKVSNSGLIGGAGNGSLFYYNGSFRSLNAAPGMGVVINGDGTVMNSGTIQANSYTTKVFEYCDGLDFPTFSVTYGSSGIGIKLTAGGNVTNAAGAVIEGNEFGVSITGGVGTVVNAGTIIGTTGIAAALDGNAGGLVVDDPGAVFQGTVSGGNASASTLELASTATTGTLSGLGSTYVNFDSINIDTGAHWLLTGANTVGSAVTLTNAGALNFTGTFDDAGAVIGAGDTAISFGDLNSMLTIEQGAVLQGEIAGFLPGDTIDLANIVATSATLGANNQLNLQISGGGSETLDLATDENYRSYAFTVNSDGSGGTDIVVVLADPGPTARYGATTLGHNETVNLTSLISGLVTPGLPGDTETITAVSATSGSANVVGGIVSYTAPPAGTDTLTYTVADEYGDTATGSVNITVDTGPHVATGATTLGHGKTANLTSLVTGLITPGISGDTETLSNVSALHGTATLSSGAISYTAPETGPDTLTYTVTDGYGDTAAGSVNIAVDTGPHVAAGAATLGHGESANLTSLVTGLISPGISGDTETLSNVSALHGTVTLGNGVISYTAPATGPDTLTYTVTDEYGDTATGSVNITVDTGPHVATGATTLGHGKTANLTSLVTGLITPGIAGDTETLSNVSALHGTATLSNGVISYTAPETGPDTLTYTVTDEYGDTATGSVNITVDTGPHVAAGATTLGHGKTANLTSLVTGLITPGISGDTETLSNVSALHGTATLSNGVISYTAPTTGPDTLTYTVTDEYGDTATGSVNITVDTGPHAATGAATLGHGKTANLTSLVTGLITSGIAGDTETLSSVSALHGTATLSNGVISYTAPTTGPDTLSYTVTDEYGDIATGSVNVTVDPGPTTTTGTTTVGHNKTSNLTSAITALVSPGITGDTETVTAIAATHGVATLNNGSVTYTAPTSGSDALTYTVTDQYGDTANGTLNVAVDPGPTAGAAAITLIAGQSTDLTSYLLGLDTPGIAGDTLTLTADNTTGTLGSVTLNSGDLTYLAPPTAGTDSFGYTVSDQYGDTAAATVTITVASSSNIGNSSGTVVLGSNSGTTTFGSGNVTVVGGNGSDQISGGSGSNNITLGNGNDTVTLKNGSNTISLGTGSDSVTVGNLNNTITVTGSATSTDTINVGNGNNTLTLGAGTYNVTEGNGADTIILGDGQYNVTAGNGTPDLFIYTMPTGELTMSLGSNDQLVFRNSGFDLGVDNGHGTASLQAIAASLFSTNTDGSFANTANRFAYNTTTGDLYYDSAGSTAGSTKFLIADLTNKPHLTAASLFFTS